MKRKALFIGVNDYADNEIRDLRCSVRDAHSMNDLFEEIGYETRCLENPSKGNVVQAVSEMTSGLSVGDQFLFYFAGHGFTDSGQHLLFCADDRHELLRFHRAGIPFDFIELETRTGGFDRSFLLDACQSDFLTGTRGGDASTRDLIAIGDMVPLEKDAPGSFYVLRSCSKYEHALEIESRSHGLFTLAMMDVLRQSRRSGTELLFNDALRETVREKMYVIARGAGVTANQTPESKGRGAMQVLISGRKATVEQITPQPLPQYHRAAATLALVVCPVCGKKNDPRETFRCRKCGRDNLCLRHQDETTFLCAECTAAQRKALEEADRKAESTIKTKYDQLKRAGAPFGDPLENGIWRTPDGGWQCNYKNSVYDSKCAITLRPGDDEAYGVYGGIWEKWDAEGGVYNERKERGHMGYPVSDEEPYYQTSDRVSCFENGVIVWGEATGAHVVMVPGSIFAKFHSKYNELIKKDHSSWIKNLPIGSICRESDGGWQQKFGDWAAILLRPEDAEPHEVHGAIYKRWSEEGGASGYLGYPVSDEDIYSGDGDTQDRISHFEHGDIVWKAKENQIHVGRMITLDCDTKMELVWCPPGEFMMGSPTSEEGRRNGETRHPVRLTKGFWLGKYPITQRQWRSVMGSNPSYFKGDYLPVERISWDDCQAFIKRVNAALGCGARLPTEAEWEYACRAGTTTAYSWGNALNGGSANCVGKHPCGTKSKGPYLGKTTPVGKYGANHWGLCDMHGNVWEWCADWYGEYPTGSVIDPTGPASGDLRVLRGGGWGSSARYCRSAGRNRSNPGIRSRYYGFRLCCSALP